ncbi:TIGR04222 domain-containing membrane protein [Kutzneria viridogrisea]|uniref:TIGR04222 domain-containing membrane protein n=2 Tax=Kutzneria TaxID=43356 RepID=W5WPS8_9PSEU|nr:TIGR04222 domain-containing membrane protein [Kutzneria albida]AHI00160.1 hypothetical protein KALB_6801 [Kutzneria albida DSM 43870]MBA8925337.1 uncharacterized protein (TIGR04222 family) [Kutzneria viridogrisea]
MGQEPWGISGPEFLSYYLVGIGVALLAALLVRVAAKAAQAGPARQLSASELGYLSGGPARAVETAVARLLESGALRASRGTGYLVATGPASADPLEAAVLRKCRPPTGYGLVALQNRLAESRELAAIGEQLVRDGLVVAPARARGFRTLSAAPMGLVFLVGLARFVNGVNLHRPAGWLGALLVLSAALTVLLALLLRKQHLRTFRGDRVLSRTMKARNVIGSNEALLLGGAAGAVVLGGLLAFPDRDVTSAIYPATMTTGSSGSSWWGGGGGGGSSCSSGGGSSCGGGGGGGCGGGGCGG